MSQVEPGTVDLPSERESISPDREVKKKVNICFLLKTYLRTLVNPTDLLMNILLVVFLFRKYYGVVAIFIPQMVNSVVSFVFALRAGSVCTAQTSDESGVSFVEHFGRWELVPPEEWVEGDVIKLVHGNRVAVDGILLSGKVVVRSSIEDGISTAIPCQPGDRVRCGMFVMEGIALAKVTRETTDDTAAPPTIVKESSDLEKMLSRLIVSLLGITLVVTFAVSGVSAGYYEESLEQILLLMGVYFLLGIPFGVESLSAILVHRSNIVVMDSHRVRLQRPSALYSLALANIACVDKTDTITCGIKVSSEHYVFQKHYTLHSLLELAALCTRWREPAVSAKDLAILRSVNLNNCDAYTQLEFNPQTEEHHYTTSLLTLSDGSTFRVAKGGPSEIIDLLQCHEKMKQEVLTVVEKLKQQSKMFVLVANCMNEEKGWQPVGVIIFEDAIVEGAEEIVKDLWDQFAIQTKLLSGDGPERTASVANDVGIPGNTIIQGGELPPAITEASEPLLGTLYADITLSSNIFAGLRGSQKALVVEVLQQCSHKVVYVGNGANDAEAFRLANASVAVPTSVSTLLDSSDIVLLEEDYLPLLLQLIEKAKACVGFLNLNLCFRTASLIYHLLVVTLLFSFPLLLSNATPIDFSALISPAIILVVVTASHAFALALDFDEDSRLKVETDSFVGYRGRMGLVCVVIALWYALSSLGFVYFLTIVRSTTLFDTSADFSRIAVQFVLAHLTWGTMLMALNFRSVHFLARAQRCSATCVIVMYCAQAISFGFAVAYSFLYSYNLFLFGLMYLIIICWMFVTFLVAEFGKVVLNKVLNVLSVCTPAAVTPPNARRRRRVHWMSGVINTLNEKVITAES